MDIKSIVYKLLYEEFIYLFAKREFKTEVDVNSPKVWKKEAFSKPFRKFENGKEMRYRIHEVTHGRVSDNMYYYHAYLKAKKFPSLEFREQALLELFEYTNFTHKGITSSLKALEKAKVLLDIFENNHKGLLRDNIENNRLIRQELKPIIRHLINGKWWFCFRGHPTKSKPRSKSWLLVYNTMTFIEEGQQIKVEKIKKNQQEKYQNTYGYIALDASNDKTLAINVSSKDGLREHCHIKLNVEYSNSVGKSLFLGDFVQHESDGYISSGSAILIRATYINDDGEERPYSDKNGEDIIYEPGHFSNLEELADGKESLDYEPPSDMPLPFRDIAFYFVEKNRNMRRTTNQPIVSISTLQDWKENNFQLPSRPSATTQQSFVTSARGLIIDYPSSGDEVPRFLLAKGKVINASKIWIVVRPTGSYRYWVQPEIKVNADGTWKKQIYIGSADKGDVGARYQIRAFVNPSILLNENDELDSWPDAQLSTELVEVIRA